MHYKTLLIAAGFMVQQALALTPGKNVVAYWGMWPQEKSLAEVCDTGAVDVVVLSFLNDFPGQVFDGMPTLGMSLSPHCDNPDDEIYFDNLPKCTNVGDDIKKCQDKGVKVLLGLGGPDGTYGFSNDQEATDLAKYLWNIFGGGSSEERPFGDGVIDGFDLDFQNGNQVGTVAFANELKSLFGEDSSKDYYLAASPQCPSDDKSLGDVLSSVALDFAFVQFYNNECSLSGTFNWDYWQTLAASSPNPDMQVFVGLTGDYEDEDNFYEMDTVKSKVDDTVLSSCNFGGFLVWRVTRAIEYINFDNVSYLQDLKNYLLLYLGPRCETPSSSTEPSSSLTSSSESLESSSSTESSSTLTSSTESLESSSTTESSSIVSSTESLESSSSVEPSSSTISSTESLETTISSTESSSTSASSSVSSETTSEVSSSEASSSETSSVETSSVETSSVETSSAETSSVETSSFESSSFTSTETGTGSAEGQVTETVTDVLSTIVTITSCSDHKCHETTVPATWGPVTTTLEGGVVTVYTTWCPETNAETNALTTTITITSCSDNKCHETTATATWGPITTTLEGGEVTVYTTWCPLTEATATSVYATVVCTEDVCKTASVTGVVPTALSTLATVVGDLSPTEGASEIVGTSANGTAIVPISTEFNGAGKIGSSVLALVAIPLAYLL